MKIRSQDASCIICRLCAYNYTGSYIKRLQATMFPKRGLVHNHTFSYSFPVKVSMEEAWASPFTPEISPPGPEGSSEGPASQVTVEGSRASAQAQQLGHRGRCSSITRVTETRHDGSWPLTEWHLFLRMSIDGVNKEMEPLAQPEPREALASPC